MSRVFEWWRHEGVMDLKEDERMNEFSLRTVVSVHREKYSVYIIHCKQTPDTTEILH